MKMIKKTAILLAVMLTLAMCFTFGVSAEGELTDGAFTYTVANDKATIVKVDPSAEDGIFVPAELGGYPVEGIALDAFEGCDGILTVHYCGTQQDWDIICAGNDVLSGKALHLAVTVPETPAKCEETGLTEGVQCEACDKWFTEQSEIPALGHSFTNYQPDGNATIFADGTKTAYCDNGCGVSDTLKDEGSMLAFGKPESVTSVTTTSSITLNWTEVKGATGYRIFYMTANGWKKCATLTDTTRTFSNLKAGAKFTFAVRAYNIDGDVLTWAPTYSTYETSTQAVAPAKITVAQNTNAIRLNWTACPGATGYRIYYKLPSGASWKVSVSTTGNTTHTYTKLKPGSKYTFAVRPYIKTADAVIWSAYTTYTAATKPATPVTKVSSPSVGTVTVSWNAVNGADGYRVYYKLNNGAYKLYRTYTSATTLTFNNLKGGDKYTFAVRAGVRTSGGVVWSGYQEKSVTLAYRIQRYLNAIKNGTYYIEMHDGQGYYDGVALKNGSACVRMNYAGEVFRIVYNKKTNKVYDIYDTGKEYIELVDDGTFAEMTSGLSGIDVNTKIIKSTTEKVGSKTYFVEVEIEDGVECKYYFDRAALVMEKLTYEGESIVYYYSQFTNKVPDSLFTIPSDYKKITV